MFVLGRFRDRTGSSPRKIAAGSTGVGLSCRFTVARIRAHKGAFVSSPCATCRRLCDAEVCAPSGLNNEVTCDGPIHETGVTSLTGQSGTPIPGQSGMTSLTSLDDSTPSFGYMATFLNIDGVTGMALSSSGLEVFLASSSSAGCAVDVIHLETGHSRRLDLQTCLGGSESLRVAMVGGKMVVSDFSLYAIKLLDVATGKETALAGSGFQGISDGVGSDARFCGPSSMAALPGGEDVLVLDVNSIRKVSLASGEVTRVGTFLPADCQSYDRSSGEQLHFLGGHIAVSSDGLVAASGIGSIYSISMETGAVVFLVRSNLYVAGLAFLRGGSHLLVSDETNTMVWMLELETLDWCIVAGTMGDAGNSDGARGSGLLSSPGVLIMMPDGKRVLVADSNTLRVVNVDMEGHAGLCDVCPCGDSCAPGTVYSCGFGWIDPFSWKHGTYFGFLTFGSYIIVLSFLGATPLCCCCILERRRRRAVRPLLNHPLLNRVQRTWPPQHCKIPRSGKLVPPFW